MLSRQNLPIRKHPCRIARNTLVLARLDLALPIGSRTLEIRQESCGVAEHALGILTMWAPECAVENHAFIGETLCKAIVLPRLGLDKEARAHSNHNECNQNKPENKNAVFHDESIAEKILARPGNRGGPQRVQTGLSAGPAASLRLSLLATCLVEVLLMRA